MYSNNDHVTITRGELQAYQEARAEVESLIARNGELAREHGFLQGTVTVIEWYGGPQELAEAHREESERLRVDNERLQAEKAKLQEAVRLCRKVDDIASSLGRHSLITMELIYKARQAIAECLQDNTK